MYDQAKGANNELLKALRAGLQQKQLRFQIRLLRAIDPESSEMAEMVFRHPESHRRDEDNDRQARYPWEDQISDRNANYIDTEGQGQMGQTNSTSSKFQS